MMITTNDIDFLTDTVENITDEKIDILPSLYIESVRKIKKGLSPKAGAFEFSYTPYLEEIFNHAYKNNRANRLLLRKTL